MFGYKKSQKKKLHIPELTEWDRKFMAYHEAGHAVCSYFIPESEPLILITIDPSSEAFGMIQTKARLHHNETVDSLMRTISVLLSGRISEKIFFDTFTTSCIHDLQVAQQIASDMVIRFGMGKNLGITALSNNDTLQISDQMSDKICVDIQEILLEAEKKSEKILSEHLPIIKSLAEKLLQEKTLCKNEIEAFFEAYTGE